MFLTSFLVCVGLIITVPIVLEQIWFRCVKFPRSRKKYNVKGKVAVVTGGSEGIGLAMVQELLKQGIAKVYILSRSETKLEAAKKQLLENLNTKDKDAPTQEIVILPCDVTNQEQIATAAEKIEDAIDFLFVNQGMSIPGYFLEQTTSDFVNQININYLGSVYITKALISKRSKNGMGIIFTGSTISFYTCVGFTGYGPSKYALRGFVESLWSEFQGHNEYHFHLAMPSDTKTPGFDRENESKPKETEEISGVASCCTAEETARDIINQMKEGRFYITNDFLTYLLSSVFGGLSGPRTFLITETTISILLQYPLQIISLYMAYVSRKYASERKKRFEPAPIKDE